MAENRLPWAELVAVLRGRSHYRHARNLVLIALPLGTAHRLGPDLAQAIGADYLDFDCQLLARLREDDWQDHVALEQRGNIAIGRMLAQDWLAEVAGRISAERPLVISNVNLAVRYEVDLAAALYDASERGLVVIAAAGHLQGQTLLVHGLLPQTGAGSSAYELAPSAEPAPPDPPDAVQDRLI